jgi:6-pyruvoyltetrahydropterin/6-carboxytetrahydropterin synthase
MTGTGVTYTVAVRRDFVAQHVLTAGSGGPEHVWHSHAYRLEVRLEGPALDTHGYLVDISEVERHLDALVDRYRDRTLNELPELAGLNPSLEHVARVACEALAAALPTTAVHHFTVQLWESPTAWASHRLERLPSVHG